MENGGGKYLNPPNREKVEKALHELERAGKDLEEEYRDES
jgi:hypothetical protein